MRHQIIQQNNIFYRVSLIQSDCRLTLLSALLFGFLGILLMGYGVYYQIERYIAQDGYLNLNIRWPLSAYMAVSLIAILSLFISQCRLLESSQSKHFQIQLKNYRAMKTKKITFSQKAEEYYRDINDYKGDWPGIKFSSSLQCKLLVT